MPVTQVSALLGRKAPEITLQALYSLVRGCSSRGAMSLIAGAVLGGGRSVAGHTGAKA